MATGQFSLEPAVGIGGIVVAGPGRSLPCPGQDLDDRPVPVHGLFHGKWLAQERFAFAEPTLVGHTVRCALRWARNFGRLNGIAEPVRWSPARMS